MAQGTNSRDASDDEVVLVFVAVGALALLVANWKSVMGAATQWLVDHRVLVTDAVVVRIPEAAGAGLDTARIAIAVAVLLLAVVVALAMRTGRRRRNGLGE